MKDKKDNLISQCCKSKMEISGIDDFSNMPNERGQTRYYTCIKCKKPCDFTSKEKPLTRYKK